MQDSDVPIRLPIPFGQSAGGAFIRTIPTASQIGVTPGAASLTDGFPPLTATPIGAGGVPPSVKDMNGILYEVSGWSRWVAAGGPIFWEAAFSAAIGGYPKSAIVASPVTFGTYWLSTVENNVTNPDAGGAGWNATWPVEAQLADIITGTVRNAYLSPKSFRDARATGAEVLAGLDNTKYVTPAALSTAFPAGIAGVYRLPGGKIMQEGFVLNSGGEGGYTTPFNTPFPNAVRSVQVTPVINFAAINTDWAIDWQFNTTSLTTLGYFINRINDVGTALKGVSWLAFGS
jgi:hypothetical protein